jgi:hypothetical protein
MKHQAPDITRLVRNLVRLNGRDADAFEASILDEGSIAIHNATTAVYYAPEGWVSKFNRHLHRGFFDAPLHAATPHAFGPVRR